jgi:hypothetical protein
MMYFCLLLSSFVALYSGQTLCVYMGCTDIDYCIYDICGLWMVLVFFYGYVHGYVYGCVWVCVWGYVYGYRVSILREARFNKYRGLPLLGARLNDSPNFSNFSRQKMEKFAPVCSVKQIFLVS